MSRLTKNECEFCAVYLHERLLDLQTPDIPDKFEVIMRMCHQETDDFTERIFREFILCGRAAPLFQKYSGGNLTQQSDITGILVFKQSKNSDINFLAKYMYLRYGSHYKKFLEWQVDLLAQGKEIDLYEEWDRYKSATDDSGSHVKFDEVVKHFDDIIMYCQQEIDHGRKRY